MKSRNRLILSPLTSVPEVRGGDDLTTLVEEALKFEGIQLEDGDILVVAQKIVSKAERRLVNLEAIKAGDRAKELSDVTGKDPRLVELMLQESAEILRTRPGLVVCVHRLGFVCANAGIDHSNVGMDGVRSENWVLLLPEDPDRSAHKIRCDLERVSGKKLGVLIIDSHGRAWREGIVGAVIGLSGVPGVVDLRGVSDRDGFPLHITRLGAADELASAASLVMGQAAESVPVVHVSGFPYVLRESSTKEILRSPENDLFR
jgi:coenzyme F420-0:L-glutamate ligase / coenzyme F420-1:gamma-L-glutamate ligase